MDLTAAQRYLPFYLTGGDLPQKRLELIGDLCDRLGTDRLDLVILSTAPPGLRARVVRSKRVLAERMPTKRHAFESRTLREYMDFSGLENRILEQRYRHG